MRECSLCHTPDRPELVEDARCNCQGGEVMDHSPDCAVIEHFVQKDIRPHDGPLTKRLREKGWTEREKLFRGRKAIERLICIPCAVREAEIGDMVAYRKRKVEEMDPNQVPTMYQILCS